MPLRLPKSLTDPSEILGVLGISLGLVGAILQILRVHKTRDTTSFAPVALFLSVAGESFFAAQGALKHSLTLTLTRVCSALYAAYLLVMVLFFGEGDASDAMPTPSDAECIGE